MSDEIVRLLHAVKTENAKLRAALKPFAMIGGPYKGEEGRDPESAMGDRNETERLLNAAMDHIASTLEQPSDQRAWDYLLIYCPREALEKRIAAITAGKLGT